MLVASSASKDVTWHERPVFQHPKDRLWDKRHWDRSLSLNTLSGNKRQIRERGSTSSALSNTPISELLPSTARSCTQEAEEVAAARQHRKFN